MQHKMTGDVIFSVGSINKKQRTKHRALYLDFIVFYLNLFLFYFMHRCIWSHKVIWSIPPHWTWCWCCVIHIIQCTLDIHILFFFNYLIYIGYRFIPSRFMVFKYYILFYFVLFKLFCDAKFNKVFYFSLMN